MKPEAAPAKNAPLETALERLTRFHPKSMDLSLDRVRRLLGELGHPEGRLPPVVHVAGTNGKGSTVAFMRSILESAGLKVHAYTSPHLVHFNERIRVAGRLLSDDELLAAIDEVERVNDGQPITFFEITTAIAFHLFAKIPADAVLLETGLGGILDATNVVDHPAATVITRISYDHMHLLGDTITLIAGEKAGIMKRGSPAIMSYQADSEAIRVVSERAQGVDAPLFAYGEAWSVTPNAAGFTYEDRMGRLDLPLPGLLGQHQFLNAGAAIAALRHSGRFTIAQAQFAAGVAGVDWPGRLQRLTQGPLSRLIPQGSELWLDGGHNDSGGEVLAVQAGSWSDKPLSAVFGMLTTKDPAAFLKPLAPFFKALRAVEIPGEALSLSAGEAADAATAAGIPAEPASSIHAAIHELVGTISAPQRILICGSLYLAGSVLADNG